MADKRKNNGDSVFMSGVFVLGLSAVIVKIIGLIYKIPMLRLLGSEGMGYFNSAYELYAMLCTVSTAGLPVAMSVMISSCRDNRENTVSKIFKVSMRLFLIIGILGSVMLFAFAHPISIFLKSEKAAFSILAISPTVLLICIASAYRGYFQGLRRMAPTAISQVIEAVLKLVLGLLFAYIALGAELATEAISAFAVMGLVAGSAVSALYLAFAKRLSRVEREAYPKANCDSKILPQLMKIAIPVTLSSALAGVARVIDMSAILRRLQTIGYNSSQAFSVYGSYTTLVVPLFALTPALISSVALPLVPSLSGDISNGDREAQVNTVSRALSLTMLLACPVSLGLTLYSKEILELIFSNETEAIAVSAPLLALLGLSVPLSCMITVGNAVLQAYSKAHIPILSMLIGALIKIVLAFALIGNENIGILGAPISTFFCDLAVNLVNFGAMSKVMPSMPSVLKTFAKPTVVSFISLGGVRILYLAAQNIQIDLKVLTVLTILLSALVYGVISLLVGTIDINELKALYKTKEAKI